MPTRLFFSLKFALPLVALVFGSTGCTIEHVHFEDDGLLTVQWSLDDTFDPDACLDYGARTIELVVYDHYDDVVDHFEVRCADFATSIELPDGAYGLDATLLDRSGRAVTTTLALEVDVYEGEETFVDIDFPIDSLR